LTEPLQVGQFAIVDGEPVDRGPNAGNFRGKGPTDDRAELFVLAEGTTPAGEAFAGHLVSALGQTWNTLDMSLTGALARLFDDAERNLGEWNRKSIAQHRVSIGLTAFGRRGPQSVIAQAGPSAVFHLHAGKVQSYFTDAEHGRPIGSGPVVPQFTRIDYAPGDRILLISTVALSHLDDEIIAGIVALPGEQILPDLFHRLETVRHLTAMLVTCMESRPKPPAAGHDDNLVIDATSSSLLIPGPSTPSSEALKPPASTFQPSLFIDDQAEDVVLVARRRLEEVTPRPQIAPLVPAVVTEMPAPLARVSGESPLMRIAAERRARAALSQAAVASAAIATSRMPRRSTGSNSEPVAALSGQPPRRRHDRRDSFSRGLVREDGPPPAPHVSAADAPLVDELASEHRARNTSTAITAETIAGDANSTLNSGGSLIRVRGSMGGRWKGGGSLSRRSTVNAQLPPTWIVIVVGLGILLTLVGVLTVPGMLDRQSSQRYANLMNGATQRLTTSRVQPDPAQKRIALTEAQAMLLEAQGLSEAGPDAADMLKQVKSAIEVMDAIRAPTSVDVIGSLDQFGDRPVNVARLTVTDDTAYVLDSASSQVIAVTLAAGDKKVVYAEDKDAKHGRPLATAFLESGDGGSALLVIDASNQLWALGTGGPRSVTLNLPSNAKVTDIAVNGRDLYVLDASNSVVYKSSQVDGGFGGPAARALETPDLAAARRLMVDGDIVTSDANGALHRFAGQLALTLSQGGIDHRLVAAELPQTLSKDGDLFVLDAPNERITVFRRDGVFDRQYRHKDFRNSSAFAVRKGVGYLFSDGKLRRVAFN
jgi:hypothetical protein